MEDAPTPDQTAQPDATDQPEAPEAAAAQPEPSQLTMPDLERDPLARATIERAKAEEVARLRAEAEKDRKAEREALEAKLRAEAEERRAADEAEAARMAQLSEVDRLKEQLSALDKRDAEREASRLEAEREAAEARERLEFVRAVIGAGKRLAKDEDPALEDLAHTKARALVAQGKTMPEAIAELAESNGYLFAAPAKVEPAATSTAAGASAPRGTTNPVRPPSRGPEVDALRMDPDAYAAWKASGGHMSLVTPTDPRKYLN